MKSILNGWIKWCHIFITLIHPNESTLSRFLIENIVHCFFQVHEGLLLLVELSILIFCILFLLKWVRSKLSRS